MRKMVLPVFLALSIILAACGNTQVENKDTAAQAQPAAAADSSKETEADIEEVSGRQDSKTGESVVSGESYLEVRSGAYHLNSITQGSETMSASEIAGVESLGMEMSITLFRNGRGLLKVFGEKKTFRWNEDSLIFPEETVGYTWDERKISFKLGGTSYVFSDKDATEQVGEEHPGQAGSQEESREGQGSYEGGNGGSSASGEPSPLIAEFSFAGAEWLESYDGESNVLCIWYDYTNLTDGYLSPNAFAAEMKQDDTAITDEDIVLSDTEHVTEADNRNVMVSPGASNRGVHLFEANPYGGEIDYTVRNAQNDTLLFHMVLDPSSLPGRPDQTFLPNEGEQYSLPEGVKDAGPYEEVYEIAVKDAETVNAADSGKEMIRVWFEFTNNSAETVSPYMVVYLRAVQNGLSLNPGWSSIDDPELNHIYEDVEPGKKLLFCYEWYLITDAPVFAEIYDWFSEETLIGKEFPINETRGNFVE